MAFGRQHPEWVEFETRLRARIAELQDTLESPLGLDETNFVRGQIAEIRHLLGEQDKPRQGAKPPVY